jgi:hypothetical protein
MPDISNAAISNNGHAKMPRKLSDFAHRGCLWPSNLVHDADSPGSHTGT